MVDTADYALENDNVEKEKLQEAPSTQSFFSARSISEPNNIWKEIVTTISRRATATYEKILSLMWKTPHHVYRTILTEPFYWQLLKSISFFILALKLFRDFDNNLTFDMVE